MCVSDPIEAPQVFDQVFICAQVVVDDSMLFVHAARLSTHNSRTGEPQTYRTTIKLVLINIPIRAAGGGGGGARTHLQHELTVLPAHKDHLFGETMAST